MPADHPSDAGTPPHLTLFDATESQLVDELKRRNTAVVVIRERAQFGPNRPGAGTEFVIEYRGGLTYVIGLLARATMRIHSEIQHGANNSQAS